jgi:hypothetical protein
VLFGWLLFRVEDMAHLALMLGSFLGPWNSWVSAGEIALYMALPVGALVLIQVWQRATGELDVMSRAGWPVRAVLISMMLAVVLFLNRSHTVQFIYFQF